MDAAEATTLGAWASIRGYFTPATLFLVLNIVIGTIALTSRSHQQRRRREHYHDYAHHPHHQQGQYPAELLISDPHPHPQQQEYHYYQQPPPQYATPPPAPAPLARTSSIMDRLRSIGLYRFRSGDFPPEYAAGASHDVFAPVVEEATTEQAAVHYARSRSEPAPAREVRRAPPKVMKKSGTVVVGGLKQQEPSSPRKVEHQHLQEEQHVPPPAPMRAPPPLSRTSSVLDRLRSLGLYNFLAAEQPSAVAAAAAPPATDPHAHVHYDRSRSEPAAREQGKKEKKQVAEARMGKSSSTSRKPAAAGPSLLEDDCVDARAEAFIDSFRKEQSLKQLVHHDEDDEHAVVPPPPAPLARTSSVLDRLRSFSLYLRSVDPPVPEDPVKAPSAAADAKQQQQAQYGRSRSEPAREQGKKKTKQQGAAGARMSKTTSEAAARNRTAEEAAPPGEECVDARADDFINKFRQQLQLQRLNSLLSYKQQQ